MTLGIGLFLAGVIEYAVIAAWYDCYARGQIVRLMLVTHVQIALWLFVLGSTVAMVDDPTMPKWLALSYTEGCAIGAGVMCWRSRRLAASAASAAEKAAEPDLAEKAAAAVLE